MAAKKALTRHRCDRLGENTDTLRFARGTVLVGSDGNRSDDSTPA